MSQSLPAVAKFRYLENRPGSAYAELFVSGTSLRAQSLVSDMENEGWSAEAAAAAYHIPVEAVREAMEYVHDNEEYLAERRRLSRHRAIAKGYLRSPG